MRLKDRYAKLILDNAEAVAQVESMLRAALLLVPGRFRDSELTAEVGNFPLSSPISFSFLPFLWIHFPSRDDKSCL